MKLKTIVLVTAFLCATPLHAVVILIHGTFANDVAWCRPGGQFYQNLELTAKVFGEKLIPFAWSGSLSDSARVQGAEALAKVILSYPADERIILIGHSHGGNVMNIASQLLNDPVAKLLEENTAEQNLVEINNMINGLTPHAPQTRSMKTEETWDAETQQQYLDAYCTVQQLKQEKRPLLRTPQKALIDVAYLIATPISMKHYAPDMSVISQLYSFYSKGDRIQPVFGFYKRLVPHDTRRINFRITIEDSGFFDDDPSHSEIHGPEVGKWILTIPEKLHQEQVWGFENFSTEKNGKIHFDENGVPHYKRDKRSTAEREKKEKNRQKMVKRKHAPPTAQSLYQFTENIVVDLDDDAPQPDNTFTSKNS